jgi:hypothetical protein
VSSDDAERVVDYPEIPGLSYLYLEDSYVLDITETPARFVFRLDAVLTPQHPAYQPPPPGQRHCYARGELTFPDVVGIEWVTRTKRRYTDADGEKDLGNIDILRLEESAFIVEGDWGRVRIVAAQPVFELRG